MITGEIQFIFVENAGRILAGQCAMLVRANDSYLYDLNGNLLNSLLHDFDTKQIGITEDEKYFWFAANKIWPLEPGEEPFSPYYINMTHTPYNHIMVFDVYTGEFLEDFSTRESDLKLIINGAISKTRLVLEMALEKPV